MTTKLITTKLLEITTDMKNTIVENAIHMLKELEAKREPLEKVYMEKKSFIDELQGELKKFTDEFEPIRAQYEGYDNLIATQEKIIDLYSRGKSKEEVITPKKKVFIDDIIAVDTPSVNSVAPINKGSKQISWLDIFHGYISHSGRPMSFEDLWQCFLNDASLQHRLIVNGMLQKTLYNKWPVARNCGIHATYAEGGNSLKRSKQRLYFFNKERVDVREEVYWIHPRK